MLNILNVTIPMLQCLRAYSMVYVNYSDRGLVMCGVVCCQSCLQSSAGGQRCLVGTKAARVRCYAAEAVLVARRYVETMGGVAFIKIDFKMLSIRYAETRSWSYSSD